MVDNTFTNTMQIIFTHENSVSQIFKSNNVFLHKFSNNSFQEYNLQAKCLKSVLGSVVSASALYSGGPGLKSHQVLDFFGSSHTRRLKVGSYCSLPGAQHQGIRPK